MDYRSTSHRRNDRVAERIGDRSRDQRPQAPRSSGPNATETIHRRLFSDYKPAPRER